MNTDLVTMACIIWPSPWNFVSLSVSNVTNFTSIPLKSNDIP